MIHNRTELDKIKAEAVRLVDLALAGKEEMPKEEPETAFTTHTIPTVEGAGEWVMTAYGRVMTAYGLERRGKINECCDESAPLIPSDPLDALVDGLTVRECLRRFATRSVRAETWLSRTSDAIERGPGWPEWDNKGDHRSLHGCEHHDTPMAKRERRFFAGERLTNDQLAAARSAWSAELRAKVKQSAEKERNRVVCDKAEDGE